MRFKLSIAVLVSCLATLALADQVVTNPTITGVIGTSVKVGTGTASATVCGTLDASVTEVSTIADTNLTTLYSYTIPANTISANTRGIEITAYGKFGATGNTKNMFVQLGGTNVYARSSAGNNLGWSIVGRIQRQTSGTYLASGDSTLAGASFSMLPVSSAQDFTAPAVLTVKSQNGTAAAGDTTLQGVIVRCF